MAGGRFYRRILGILLLLLPVESANDRLANHCCLNRVVCLSHSPCEARQFVSAQFSLGVELIGKTDDTQLFFWVQTSDLFDDLIGQSCSDSNAQRWAGQLSSRAHGHCWILRPLK